VVINPQIKLDLTVYEMLVLDPKSGSVTILIATLTVWS